jgi:hypothetical protein
MFVPLASLILSASLAACAVALTSQPPPFSVRQSRAIVRHVECRYPYSNFGSARPFRRHDGAWWLLASPNPSNDHENEIFEDWDGIGAIGASKTNDVVPSTREKSTAKEKDKVPTRSRDADRMDSPSTPRRNVDDEPSVYSRKFTGSLFADSNPPASRRDSSSSSSSNYDRMMEREYNLAGIFERTLPFQAGFIALALAFVVYVSLQEPVYNVDLSTSTDVMIDDSLLPDFWSQFQGDDRVNVEEIGQVSGESVFI